MGGAGAGGKSATGGSGAGGTGAGGSGAGGSGAGGSASGALLPYKPCDQATRVGGFAVELKRNEGSTPFTALSGGVKNAVDPTAVWQELAKEGDCRVQIGRMLVCNTPCAAGKICAGSNMCVDEPATQDLGTVTFTGLGAPVPLMLANFQYSGSLPAEAPYPPVAAEAEVHVQTGGGKYAAFTLAGRGLAPIELAGPGPRVARNQPLPVTWKAPAKAGSARVHIKLDIAHHGGISARLECDVADSGSVTIPSTLINQLMDRGVAGFPSLSLTRQTADSTTIAPGCVDFVVASEEAREVEVEGVVSCNQEHPCPSGKTCQQDLTCK
jgi:hypothetical protein